MRMIYTQKDSPSAEIEFDESRWDEVFAKMDAKWGVTFDAARWAKVMKDDRQRRARERARKG